MYIHVVLIGKVVQCSCAGVLCCTTMFIPVGGVDFWHQMYLRKVVQQCSCAGVPWIYHLAGQATLCTAWRGFSRPSIAPRGKEGGLLYHIIRGGGGRNEERGPPRVKLRNSVVFCFITSARISCAARTPFYSPPKQRCKTVLSTKVLTGGV